MNLDSGDPVPAKAGSRSDDADEASAEFYLLSLGLFLWGIQFQKAKILPWKKKVVDKLKDSC